MNKIKSFLDACKVLKIDPKKLPIVKHLPKKHAQAIIAQYHLWVIAQAINGKWSADYNNRDQIKYFPVFYFKKATSKNGKPSLGFYYVSYWDAASFVGSRLCFGSSEQAEYFGKKFIKLHERVHRID